MSTANKLTYLNTTKGKIKDSINLTGANIGSSDTFRSYSAKLRDGLVDVINDGGKTLYNNFPKATGTGSDITLNNTYQALIRLNLKGNIYQKQLTGKNVIPNNLTSGSQNGITWVVNSDGSIKLSGTATARVEPYLFYNYDNPFTIKAGTYRNTSSKMIIIYAAGYSVINSGETITFSSDKRATEIYFRIENNTTVDETYYPQMILSSITDTSYEQYCGGTPSPNPSYPQNIEVVTGYNEVDVVGKNLFNKNNFPVLQGTVPEVNGAELTEAVKNRTTYIPCRPNTTYTIQRRNDGDTNRFGVAYTKTLPVLNVLCYGGIRNNDATSISITTGSEAKYLVLFFYRTDETTLTYQQVVDSIQIEQNTSATTYEPYQSQSYEVNLGKNLVPINISSGTTNNGVTITKLEDGSYSLNGTSTTGFTWDLYNGDDITIPAGTYTGSIGNITNMGGCYIRKDNGDYQTIAESTTSNTFTINNTFTFNRMYIYVHNAKTFNNQIIKPMLEEGSKVTPYSPYKTPIEMCKINDYKDEIRRSTGKNLFDKDNANVLNAYATVNTPTITSNNNFRTLYIPCKENTTYAISKILSTRFSVSYTTDVPTIGMSVNGIVQHNDYTTEIFTTGNNAKYLVVLYYNAASDTLTEQEILDTIQIEENTQATELEPYGVGVWYKYNKIGKVVLDGSESWELNGENDTHGQFIYNVTNKASGTLNILCNKFINEAGATGNYIYGRPQNNRTSITIAKSICAYNLDTFKTWLSNNFVYFYFLLSTPTITTLDTELQTQLEDIYNNAKSYLGQTNITAEYVEGNQPFIMDVSALLKEE